MKRKLLAIGAAVVMAMLVLPGSADAAEVILFNQSSTPPSGWHSSPPTLRAVFLVDGDRDDHQEHLLGYRCTAGDDVLDSWEPADGTFRNTDTYAYPRVTTEGSNVVECVGDYRWRARNCSIWGCSYGEWRYFSRSAWRSVLTDFTAPVVTATASRPPDSNGWYNAPFTIRWRGTDALSGIRSCGPAHQYTGNEQTVPWPGTYALRGGCYDRAGYDGNLGTASFDVRYDPEAPELDPAVPSPLHLGATATADPGARDGRSGVDSATCDPLDTSSVGWKTVSCTATDVAGNTATATADYQVTYVFGGFEAPVDGDAVNEWRAGQIVPLRFGLQDANGRPVTSLEHVTVETTGVDCERGSSEDLPVESAGRRGLINHDDGTYSFNWHTPRSYAGSCKLVTIELGDGGSASVRFDFVS